MCYGVQANHSALMYMSLNRPAWLELQVGGENLREKVKECVDYLREVFVVDSKGEINAT